MVRPGKWRASAGDSWRGRIRDRRSQLYVLETAVGLSDSFPECHLLGGFERYLLGCCNAALLAAIFLRGIFTCPTIGKRACGRFVECVSTLAAIQIL